MKDTDFKRQNDIIDENSSEELIALKKEFEERKKEIARKKEEETKQLAKQYIKENGIKKVADNIYIAKISTALDFGFVFSVIQKAK